MSLFPTLHTQRLCLRELVASDAPAVFDIHRDADSMRWFGADAMTELAQAESLIETFAHWRSQPNPGTRWGIEHDGKLIGSCGLFKWNQSWNSCALACELAPGARGRGLMHEALQAMLDWGFEQMKLHRVEAWVHPQNTASLQLLARLGFQAEGTLREAGFWNGQRHDLGVLGLLNQEWLAKKNTGMGGSVRLMPILSILIHVPNWRAATEWYAAAFPLATRIHHDPDDFGHLDVAGVALEIVNADDKVASGAAGSVVYWGVDDLQQALRRFEELGGTLYRGPMEIEGGHWICQVRDPWGNCIGLRQTGSSK
ncbi:GNAT family N-acetyltransferase [Pseudomonas sp. FP453]|uniref:GNAT family N-acetyltransferase n=1 Tax=Pseudomonas sp. FP453 TaxID=2954094 RepID=UPI0027325FDB|nr:GNAT family N-acetyltransferase [Pseudomonas sp. FP453]WLH92266.1 GNAT family N-acetyltransferase [Pseudomonas sp. FP453]